MTVNLAITWARSKGVNSYHNQTSYLVLLESTYSNVCSSNCAISSPFSRSSPDKFSTLSAEVCSSSCCRLTIARSLFRSFSCWSPFAFNLATSCKTTYSFKTYLLMPVAAFPLCMSTQDENVSNDVLRLTCPQSSLLNLSIAAGKV